MRNVLGAIHLHSNIHISDEIQPSNFMCCSHGNMPGPPTSLVGLLNRTSTISTGDTAMADVEDVELEDEEELEDDDNPTLNPADEEESDGSNIVIKSSSTSLLSITAKVGLTT